MESFKPKNNKTVPEPLGNLQEKGLTTRKSLKIALIGNPLSGKSTLLQHASKNSKRFAKKTNATLESKPVVIKQNGYEFKIVELPGIYSLSGYSPEEFNVRKYVLGEMPDVVINVLNSEHLERDLYLTTQLIDLDLKMVIALNMHDKMISRGDKFDYPSLAKMIGIPIIPTISTKGQGIQELFQNVIDVYEETMPYRKIHINYGKTAEESIRKIEEEIRKNKERFVTLSSRFYAVRLLEKDESVDFTLSVLDNHDRIKASTRAEVNRLEQMYNEESDILIRDARYGFISGALKETFVGGESRVDKTEAIDSFMTHRLFGYPIFLIFMFVMFFSTFELGQYPMNWLDSGVNLLSGWLEGSMKEGSFKDLIIHGIIEGVGSVIIFLPNILILFFFISLMEDTNYMSRAAFIMDKVMHKIGLHGKSFIPLLMGFGCNVPAIMATRSIENRNNRILTILINPFMSCSARLPVYILLIGAFFPGHPGLMLFLIYSIGIVLAVLVAITFKKTLFKNEEIPYVMELPPYRVPSFHTILLHMWQKGVQYLKKMGGIILVASVIIWALGYFPKNIEYSRNYDQELSEINDRFIEESSLLTPENDADIKILEEKHERQSGELMMRKEAERHEKSYIGQIGKFIEPALKPIGFDWKMGVSLLSGIAAKEIVVSTMAILYQANSQNDAKHESLMIVLKNSPLQENKKKDEAAFTPVVALAFMIFILTYFPCIAVIAAIRNETGSWKWALFTIVYTTGLAWLLAFLVYQVGNLLF